MITCPSCGQENPEGFRIGARFPEAWAALLAAERGDTARLDSALAYFDEQRATPYATRCRALMQAST